MSCLCKHTRQTHSIMYTSFRHIFFSQRYQYNSIKQIAISWWNWGGKSIHRKWCLEYHDQNLVQGQIDISCGRRALVCVEQDPTSPPSLYGCAHSDHIPQIGLERENHRKFQRDNPYRCVICIQALYALFILQCFHFTNFLYKLINILNHKPWTNPFSFRYYRPNHIDKPKQTPHQYYVTLHSQFAGIQFCTRKQIIPSNQLDHNYY